MSSSLMIGDDVYYDYSAWYMLFAKTIRFFTNGSAHVAKVLSIDLKKSEVTLIESRAVGGIQYSIKPISHFISNKMRKITIMRPPRPLNKKDVDKINSFVASKSKIERSYGWINMIREVQSIDKVFRFFGVKYNREFYCSTFIDELNEIVGFYPADDIYRSPKELMDKENRLEWECVST